MRKAREKKRYMPVDTETLRDSLEQDVEDLIDSLKSALESLQHGKHPEWPDEGKLEIAVGSRDGFRDALIDYVAYGPLCWSDCVEAMIEDVERFACAEALAEEEKDVREEYTGEEREKYIKEAREDHVRYVAILSAAKTLLRMLLMEKFVNGVDGDAWGDRRKSDGSKKRSKRQ